MKQLFTFMIIFLTSFNLAFSQTLKLIDPKAQDIHHPRFERLLKKRLRKIHKKALVKAKRVLKREQALKRSAEESKYFLEDRFKKLENGMKMTIKNMTQDFGFQSKLAKKINRVTNKKFDQKQLIPLLAKVDEPQFFQKIKEEIWLAFEKAGTLEALAHQTYEKLSELDPRDISFGGSGDASDGLVFAFIVLFLTVILMHVLYFGGAAALFVIGIVILVGGTTALGAVGATAMIIVGAIMLIFYKQIINELTRRRDKKKKIVDMFTMSNGSRTHVLTCDYYRRIS